MNDSLSCHLVDMTTLRTSVSLPLGYLQAYAQADPGISSHYRFSAQCRPLDRGIEPVWNDIQSLIERRESERYVFGFTNFFWNRNANLAVARRIKQVLPDALVIFGGNDVTNQGESLLANDSPVDVIVNGEGEIAFTNVLAQYRESSIDFQSVNGISFKCPDKGVVTTAPQLRIDDLDAIPSPFLRGTFPAKAIKNSLDIAYEFSRGCPFNCAFCYWGAATGTNVRRFSLERIREDFEFILSQSNPVARIWIADANFGMTEADVEIAWLLADVVEKRKKKILLIANWAKNTTKRVIETAKVLYSHGIINVVTLAAQSLNKEVLKIANRRNIPFSYYQQLQKEFDALRIPTYTELIFGMPGESYQSFIKGVSKVIEAGGLPVIYPLILLNNTEYNSKRMRKEYGIQSRFMNFMKQGLSDAEVLIGHDRLPYEDWLKGMGLRIAVPVFYCGILKFVMHRLHCVHGLDYGYMLDLMVSYCMQGLLKSYPEFTKLFLHCMASWDSGNYVPSIPESINENQFCHGHYLALMKCTLSDIASAERLIDELCEVLAGDLLEKHSAVFEEWVKYQKLLLTAMSQASRYNNQPIHTKFTASQLAEYGEVDLVEDDGSFRHITIRRDYMTFTPDDFIIRVFFGDIDTLRLFETVKADPTVSRA
jgi:radical SAM superfamily enzyme YgiQ (UPF0313 family)